ncbi:MAG: replicative DNA helicase [Phycisphaerales bacterium JB064]
MDAGGQERQGFRKGGGGADRSPPALDLSRIYDKLPPHAPEAEMALLGSVILDPYTLADILPLVSTPEDFYRQSNATVFRVLKEVYEREPRADLNVVADRLRERNELEAIGGAAYLASLAEAVSTPTNAGMYAKIVQTKSRLRKLIAAANQIVHEAMHAGQDEPEEARQLIDRAEQAIFEIADDDQSADIQKLEELLRAEFERIADRDSGALTGLHTGFVDLDEPLSGLQDGEMIIIAARPSMGKTALALNLAEQIAMGGSTPFAPAGDERVPVGIFSLEMSKSSLVQRLISAYSGVDSHKLRTGGFSQDDLVNRIRPACEALERAPLYIDDSPALSVTALRARARRMKQRFGIRCIVIDYLQLLTSPGAGRESRQVEVSSISRGIKALARELSVPVICLAQLNRGSEQREGNRPRMSDLRESGSIEQDADVVLLLHREAYYHLSDPAWMEENEERVNEAELIIAKQRNGPTGIVKLVWDNHTTRFKNRAGYARSDTWARDEPSGSFEPKPTGGTGTNGGGMGSAFGHRAPTADRAQDNRPFDERVDHGRDGDGAEYLEPDDETPPW